MAATLTEGRIGVTPLALRTAMSLEDLRAVLTERRYNGDLQRPGWGSLRDSEERLGRRLKQRPPGGEPLYVREPRLGPERLEARLYFDRLDTRLQRQADQQIDDQYLYISDAIDVIFTEANGGHLNVLASSTNRTDLQRFLVPALTDLRQPGDDRFDVIFGRLQGGIHPDLPLWLISRFNGDNVLAPGLNLVNLRGVVVFDEQQRQARMLRELLLSRPTLLAAITEKNVVFGAIKPVIADDLTDLVVDFQLRPDGSFTIARSYSWYAADVRPSEELFGRLASDDLSLSIVPRLEQAHAADAAWHATGRADFLAEAKRQLRSLGK